MNHITSIGMNIPSVPPSVNHYWGSRGKIRFLTKEAKEWKEIVFLSSKKVPLDRWSGFESKDLEIEIHLTFPDNRVRDIDNFSKGVLDSLKGIFYKDDSQLKKMTVTKSCVKGERQTSIYIRVVA